MADKNVAWKNFKKAMANKRAGKKSSPDTKILEDEAITVQRLSTYVAGKAQKYTRIGAREFVPYEFDEVTIPNIRRACLEHFDVGENMFCDILAGEQGPSCLTVKQIPSLNVVHVRFIEDENSSKAGTSKSNECARSNFRRPNCVQVRKRKAEVLH
jgi:hypothetical protein